MDNWELYYRTHKDKGSNAITGVPPLTFVSNGKNLVDYRIYGVSGGVGDRTRNIWNGRLEQGDINSGTGIALSSDNLVMSTYVPLEAGTYTISANDKVTYFSLRFYEKGNYIGKNAIDGNPKTFTVSNDCQMRAVFVSRNGSTVYRLQPSDINLVQLEVGSTATPYEPYGYKIPIVCGETTTNIYLDEPLGENESISMNDTGLSIPTINGSNTLSVNTEVQPSKMYIKYGSSNVNQSLMKYLEYKYKFAKE